MRRITSNVYAFPQDFEFEGETRVINPAAVETEQGVLLLDVGLPGQIDALGAHLEEAGFGFDDVETVVITHQDGDHAGALSDMKERSGATVVAHIDDAPYIAGDRQPIKSGDERYPPVPIDIEVVDGVAFRTLAGKMQVVATPGHTPGHISLYFPDEKLLISADALTADEEFGGPNQEYTPDLEEAVDSIGRLAELDVSRTLCYHGGLVEHDPDQIRTIYESLQ